MTRMAFNTDINGASYLGYFLHLYGMNPGNVKWNSVMETVSGSHASFENQ